ncbi:MAG: 3-hydroxyacyl-CoA dehydrogenase family protein [candidate division WOR-3 bacterium]
MNLDERLRNVSVIGAAGKMGSGIAALIAQEMLRLKFENPDKIYRLNLIDVSEKGLDGLRDYLKSQFIRTAEKTIVSLRDKYKNRPDLVENAEIVDAYVNDGMKLLNFGTELTLAKNSHLIFEAIIEDEKIKIKTYKSLKKLVSKDTLFLTNTSSIPIGYLDEKSGLDGRLIGYHFYNPPVVQKLVEVISSKYTKNELKDIASELGKRLRKTLVPANDISGFIGNGHFMRDGLFALDEVLRLKGKYKLTGAIYIMNRVSQDFLLRPMGIFQLIDYVGIDVFQCILKVMRTHLGADELKHKLIDKMMKKGIKGGQYPDGSQKDGFLKYDKNRPVGIYDLKKGEYFVITDDWKKKVDKQLGPLPEGFAPWKALLGDKNKEEKLKAHFSALKTMNTLGAELALSYLKRTKEIAENLVKQGVANSADDVNAVLTNGFYWLYGPINEYAK